MKEKDFEDSPFEYIEFLEQENEVLQSTLLERSDEVLALQKENEEFKEYMERLEQAKRQEIIDMFSEYIKEMGAGLEFHVEFSPKVPFCILPYKDYQALRNDKEELDLIRHFCTLDIEWLKERKAKGLKWEGTEVSADITTGTVTIRTNSDDR